MNKLSDLRTSIDLLDKAIISLLAERMRVVEKVGQYKKEKNIPALDETRWQQVISSKLELAKQQGLDQALVEKIYNQIHKYSLEMEEK
jgi:chorismate mutase